MASNSKKLLNIDTFEDLNTKARLKQARNHSILFDDGYGYENVKKSFEGEEKLMPAKDASGNYIVEDKATGRLKTKLEFVPYSDEEKAELEPQKKLFEKNPEQYVTLLKIKDAAEEEDDSYASSGMNRDGRSAAEKEIKKKRYEYYKHQLEKKGLKKISKPLRNLEQKLEPKAKPTANKYDIIEKNGQLAMRVTLAMHPSHLNFDIEDGGIVINDESLTIEQVRNLKHWLMSRGFTKFSLPEGISEETKKNFEEVDKEKAKMEAEGYNWNWEYKKTFDSSGFGSGPAVNPEQSDVPLIFGEGEKDLDEFYKNIDKTFKEREPAPSVLTATQWFTKNLFEESNSQRLGKHYTFSFNPLNDRTEFTWYKPQIRDPKTGKKNKPFMTFSVEKINGQIVIGYSVQDGSPIKGDFTDKIVENLLDQGSRYINIANVDSDGESRAMFRISCAKKGAIPTGINLKRNHLSKMIKIANEEQQLPELFDWKVLLAEQLKTNARQQGTNMREDIADVYADLIDSARVGRFKMYCYDANDRGFIRSALNKYSGQESKKNVNAHEAVGTANAAAELIQWVNAGWAVSDFRQRQKEGVVSDWNELCKVPHPLLKETYDPQDANYKFFQNNEKKTFLQLLDEQKGKDIDKIDPNDMKKIFNAMVQIQSDLATLSMYKEAQDRIARSSGRQDYKGAVVDATNKAIRSLSNAYGRAQDNCGSAFGRVDILEGKFPYHMDEPPLSILSFHMNKDDINVEGVETIQTKWQAGKNIFRFGSDKNNNNNDDDDDDNDESGSDNKDDNKGKRGKKDKNNNSGSVSQGDLGEVYAELYKIKDELGSVKQENQDLKYDMENKNRDIENLKYKIDQDRNR